MTSYTARYFKTESGYMGQLMEWPEVVTDGDDLEECRLMLRDALEQMILGILSVAWGREAFLKNRRFRRL